VLIEEEARCKYAPLPMRALPCGGLPSQTAFCASKARTVDPNLSVPNDFIKELKLRGCEVGVIKEVRTPWSPGSRGCRKDRERVRPFLATSTNYVSCPIKDLLNLRMKYMRQSLTGTTHISVFLLQTRNSLKG
jgi:hypothetical protein